MTASSDEQFEWSFSGGESVSDAQLESSVVEGYTEQEAAPPAKGMFGVFQLLEELGRGGMGVVYRARDTVAGRNVALKVILRRNLQPVHRERFQREGEITASLRHPGIVRVHSSGEADGLPFIAYELLEGSRTLDQAWAVSTPRIRAAQVRDVARALGVAHAAGVIHRDIKPDNILVDAAGNPRVSDFGLAAARDLKPLTQTGAFVGTPFYMSPEQFQLGDEKVGPEADVWALGVLLYQALTKELPFKGKTLIELAHMIQRGNPVPPHRVDPMLPSELGEVCLKALQVSPAARYPSGEAFARDLDRALAGRRPEASSSLAGVFPRLLRDIRRPVPAASLTGVLVVLVCSAIVLAYTPGPVERGPSREVLAQRRVQLDEALRLSLAATWPITRDTTPLARWRTELDLLDALAAPGDPRTAARRLLTLEGLHALATSDLVAARVKLAELDRRGDTPLLPALRAGLWIEGGDAEAGGERVWEDLTRALEIGFGRPELRGWRARARIARGVVSAEQAREALTDLTVVERARLGHLAPPEQQARVHLHLWLRELSAAEAALRGLEEVPPDLAGLPALLEAQDLLQRDEAGYALNVLEEHRLVIVALPATARSTVAAQCIDRAEEILGSESGPPPRARDLTSVLEALRAVRRLTPEQALPSRVLGPLLRIAMINYSKDHELALAIGELAPDHYLIQSTIANHASRIGAGESKQKFTAVLERAVALAPDEAKRQAHQVALCELLKDTRLYTRCVQYGVRILPSLEGGLRGRALSATSDARFNLGDAEGALRDLDEAESFLPTSGVKRHIRRSNIMILLGRMDEAYASALSYARLGPLSAKHDGAVTRVWTLGSTQPARLSEVIEAIERLVFLRPSYGGWWVRLASLRLLRGQVELAGKTLRQAATVLAEHERTDVRALSPRCLRAAEGLGVERGRVLLKALVDDLEVLRGSGTTP